MTSQKGAPVCWGSNEALPRAPSPSMQPAGQPLHTIPPGWPGPAHWLRGWAPMRSASTTRARSATSLDPQHGVVVMETWRQCIRSINNLDMKLLHNFKKSLKFMFDGLMYDSSRVHIQEYCNIVVILPMHIGKLFFNALLDTVHIQEKSVKLPSSIAAILW